MSKQKYGHFLESATLNATLLLDIALTFALFARLLIDVLAIRTETAIFNGYNICD